LSPPIEVAVAVIQDNFGRILLTKRPEHVHQGGLWEFPGGKLEAGESVAQALRREIAEELGVDILAHQPLIRLTHHYSDKSVTLDVHRVLDFHGSPSGMEGQPLKWVTLEALPQCAMPRADKPIVNALRLPEQYLITGPDPHQRSDFLKKFDAVLSSGFPLIQLRAPTLDAGAFRLLAEEVLSRRRGSDSKVLLNCAPALALKLNADGVHLNSERLHLFSSRPLPKDKWLAASCHSLAQLQQAAKIDVDFVVLSPVCATRSHPSAVPLGWRNFINLVNDSPFPVFALGGLAPADIEQCRRSGAQGMAAIGSLWPE